MEITITQDEKTSKIPVWFGIIKDNFIYKNNKLDWEQTRRRTNFKKYLKDEQNLTEHLNRWAEKAGF